MEKIKVIDRRTFDDVGNVREPVNENLSQEQTIADIFSSSLDNLDNFRFKESRYFSDQLIARATKYLSESIIDNKVSDPSLHHGLRHTLDAYLQQSLFNSDLEPACATGAFLAEAMFEQMHGISSQFLIRAIPFGRPLTSESLGHVMGRINESYSTFSHRTYSMKLDEIASSPDGAKFMRQRVQSWNRRFKFGLRSSDYSRKEELMEHYFRGAQHNFEYMQRRDKKFFAH